MVGGFNVGFVGVVSIGISALPRRYYESRCTICANASLRQ
jgi:hypothetical protein